MTRCKSRSYRIRIEADAFERLAATLIEDHSTRMADGWTICPTSGLWRTNSGMLTARIAYRLRARGATIVHTIRGINPGVRDG